LWIVKLVVTAYCLVGTTATGTHTRPGTVAVDPRVVPLGSTLRIPGYGLGRALDTGGAIKGRRIDVWMSSCAAARTWGVRRLIVRVTKH
jgi:3D (Asp-Asp-Asp) domain-containing protein